MDSIISVETIREIQTDYLNDQESEFDMEEIFDLAIDAVSHPYREGQWYDIGISCRCSECGCKNNKQSRYCPNCGAKMINFVG